MCPRTLQPHNYPQIRRYSAFGQLVNWNQSAFTRQRYQRLISFEKRLKPCKQMFLKFIEVKVYTVTFSCRRLRARTGKYGDN